MASSRGIALLLCFPLLALLIEAGLSPLDLLAHLWASVLPTYLLNSAGLVCGTVLLCLLLGAPAISPIWCKTAGASWSMTVRPSSVSAIK